MELAPGSRVLVNAPSGSGKTTLIHLLYGLRRDYRGEYQIAGQDSRQMGRKAWAQVRQRQLAVVFQDLRLFPAASGRENIALKAGLVPVKTEAQIGEMAQQLGIADKLDRPVETLSQGERQRVAIIRALCQPFEWLLMDEPFSHLDEGNIAAARTLIMERVEEEKAGFVLAGLGFDYGFETQIALRL